MGFAYAGAKMAIIHIVKQLTTMLADWRLDIRANVFCPGVYPSDMSKVCFSALLLSTTRGNRLMDMQGLMGSNDMSNEGSISPEMIPATRAGTAEDAGGALLFMVSRAGAYTSESTILTRIGQLYGC